MSARAIITHVGANGDGIAEIAGNRVFVPFALGGEDVQLAINGKRADIVSILTPSPDRIEPLCKHFTECGGCSLQHMRAETYQEWKRQLVVEALGHVGIDAPVLPIIPATNKSRRRASFSAERSHDGVTFGFRKAMSHAIEPILECHVLVPAITDAFDHLADMAKIALLNVGQSASIVVTATDTGLDVVIEGVEKVDARQRQRLSEAAIALDFARLSVGPDLIVAKRAPLLKFGDVVVTPAAGGFLQATKAAESAMSDLVIKHLTPAKNVADLFCGSGTFSLPLARHCNVHAVEAEDAALKALETGFNAATGLKRVTTEKRDLHFRPLLTKDLKAYQGLVFDPPRAGAETQANQIAKSEIKYLAAVSCNPATLARDLKILTDGGYRIKSIQPIDQFLYAPHVETVVLLTKTKKRY